jgi:hypothetical protein
MAGYVIPSILGPPTDDDLEPEGGLTGTIIAKASDCFVTCQGTC